MSSSTSRAITVAIGAGTIGTILAFLGFSYYQNKVLNNNDSNEEEDVANEVSKEMENVKKERENEILKSKDSVGGIKKEGKVKSKKEAWGQFWRGAYDDKEQFLSENENEEEDTNEKENVNVTVTEN